MAVCSMVCTDGLLLHLVSKRQPLVSSGAPFGNGQLGDSIWESHHKSSAQDGTGQTLPHGTLPMRTWPFSHWIGWIGCLVACESFL